MLTIVFAVGGLVLFSITCLCGWLWQQRSSQREKRVNLPPGSLGWPVIGESLQFMASYRSNHPDAFLQHRRLRHGCIFKTHLFGKPTVISIDPELNRFILSNEGKLFSPDYPRSLSELWGKWAILRLEGSLHRKIHGLISTFLKSSKLKDNFTRDVEELVRATMDEWKGPLICLEDEAKTVGFNATAKTLLGLTPGKETTFLRKEFHDYIAGIISLPIRIPGTTFSKSLQAKENMVRLVKDIIDKRTSKVSTDDRCDMLGVLLQEKDENGKHFPVELITDNIITFLFPSEDSVGMLITLAVKFLTECPRALQEMREENLNLRQKKDENLTWNDYMDLPFTQKVLDETLRMGNIVKGVMRRALVDIHLKGYVIPKGWAVFPFFRGVHLSGELYPDPYVFNPWRWQVKVPSINFTPFGGGPRYCSGVEVSRLGAIVFLHHLVTRFTWKADNDTILNFPFVRLARRLPLTLDKL